MRAILLKAFGDANQMYIGEVDKPKVGKSNILVKVKAAGLNRADTLQRRGKYPPPPGESDIMGLEVAGVVESVGSEVSDWKAGDEVMALLSGGGYAEYVSVPSTHALRIPKGYSMEKAAGVMETYLTTYQALFSLGKVSAGETVLVHGGASGIGTSAIQLAKTVPNVRIFATAGTTAKCEVCESLGADLAVNYKENPNFEKVIQEKVQGSSSTTNAASAAAAGCVDFVLDFVGQQYFQQNLQLLKTDGRLVYLAMLSGPIAEKIDLSPILRKRLTLMGSTLRARSLEYKTELVQAFSAHASELLDNGTLKPVIDSVVDWSEIAAAHERMEQNLNTGKIIITGM